MEQLSPLDTVFLNMETGTTPMHVGSLGIYDPSTVKGERFRFRDIIRFFEGRLHQVPSLRLRMVDVPMGLDYPYWIADPEFDIEFHVRHIALPQPGDWRQLCIQVARLHSRPLDMARSPWEIYIIEGLDNIGGLPKGCFGVVTKFHHSLVDGMFGAQLLAVLHDLSPGGRQPKGNWPDKPWVVDRIPTGVELLSRATMNSGRNLLNKGMALTRHVLPGSIGYARSLLTSYQDDSNTLFRAPKTRFNGKVSAHRVFEAVNFKLADIKAIKNMIPEITINDVMVAIVSGALRRYLQKHRELPDKSMTAMVPISVRPESKKNTQGNQVSFMFPRIFTSIADPVERLEEIHRALVKGKDSNDRKGGQLMLDSARLLPTTVTNLALRTALKYNLTSYMKPLFNTVITNVPGPQLPLYFAGARMVDFYGTGISYDTMGLFHIIFSYNGAMTLSVTCCRSMMPDPGFYAECLKESFAELYKAVVGEQPEPQAETEPAQPAVKKSAAKKPVAKKPAYTQKAKAELKPVAQQTEPLKEAQKKPQKKQVPIKQETIKQKSSEQEKPKTVTKIADTA